LHLREAQRIIFSILLIKLGDGIALGIVIIFKEKAKRRYNLSPIRNVSKMKKEVIFIDLAIIFIC